MKNIGHPTSCDIILARTGKRLEVKWGMLHHRSDDRFIKGGEEIPFWGWGFSTGRQFIERKFDYCILLAAEKDRANPHHIFTIKIEEMTMDTMGGERRSAVSSKGSFYIEFSEDKNHYYKRKWHPYGPSPIEEFLHESEKHEEKWKQLKVDGKLN